MNRTISPVTAALCTFSLLTILFVGACMTASTGAGHDQAVDLGTHLKSLADEHKIIAAAVRSACEADVIAEGPCRRTAEFGIAAGIAINTAKTTFDLHRLNTDNTITAATLDSLVKAADVSMIALETLATSAGIKWEKP